MPAAQNGDENGYLYELLSRPEKQIRLLTIFPSRNNTSIVCTVLTAHSLPLPAVSRVEKLRACLFLPPYFALSYRWIRGKSQSILVNGKSLVVDGHVHDVLRVLRSYASVPLHFWIDCICINQKDDDERSKQILLMPYVYGLSFATLIWLGKSTEESERAARYIFRLTQYAYMVRAICAFTGLQSFTPMLQDNETLLTKVLRVVRAELIRQGYAMILQIILPAVWALTSLVNVLDQRFAQERMKRCRFETLEEYRESGSNREDDTFWGGWQRGLRQTHIRKLEERAVETGEPLTADIIAQVNSQHLTLMGMVKDGYRHGRRRRQHQVAAVAGQNVSAFRENANGSRGPMPPPNPGPASKAMDARKMPSATSSNGDEKWNTWQPRGRGPLRFASEDMAKLIESTLFSGTEYFNRMWTLQEVCASRTALIIHGGILIPLSDLLKVVQYLESETKAKSEHVTKAVRLQWINAELSARRRLPLRCLLYETRDRRCQDPKDKIYALLSLMLEQPTILVEPAYHKSTAEVHANATRFLDSVRSLAGHHLWT